MKRSFVILISIILGIVFIVLKLYVAASFFVGILASTPFIWTSVSLSSERHRALMIIFVDTPIVILVSLIGILVEAIWATASVIGIFCGVMLLCTSFQSTEAQQKAIP